MSESEFEAYLALLLKSLRLRKGQSHEVTDEMRDHLESRFQELRAAGVDRAEAIRVALGELGGVSELAEQFTRLAKIRRRRLIMRCTIASSLVVACVLLLSVSLVPPVPDGPGAPPAVAQEEAPKQAAPESGSSAEQAAIAALDEKLSQVVEVEFRVPLEDAILSLGKQINADLLIDSKAIEEAGIDLKAEVILVFEHTEATARTVLEFLLERDDLAFVNRSGILFVTTKDAAARYLTLKVYNVRDLIEAAAPQYEDAGDGLPPGIGGIGGGVGATGKAGGGMPGMEGVVGGGMPGLMMPDGHKEGVVPGVTGNVGGGMGGGMLGAANASPAQRAMDDLSSLIQLSTPGPWFDLDGMGGTMKGFDGLLVMRNTEQAHGEIRRILDGLREAGRTGPGSDVTIPRHAGETGEVHRPAVPEFVPPDPGEG